MNLPGWSRIDAPARRLIPLDFCLWLHRNFDQLVEELNDQGPVNDNLRALAAHV